MSGTVTNSPDDFGALEDLRKTHAQARCDAIQAAFRSGEEPGSSRRQSPPRPPELEPSDHVLMLRLAEELEHARRLLDQMGDELAADMAVVMRHSVALQSVDIVGQMLGHIASVLRARDSKAAVDRIGMGDLKARLTQNSL